MITVQITGLKELQNALNQLPKEIQGRPLRSAVSAAAKVIVDDVKARVPVGETGNLKTAVYRYRSRRNSATGRETFFVGIRQGKAQFKDTAYNRRKGRVGKSYKTQGEAYYWRFLEFGTAKMAAKPFLRPAFESSKSKAVEVIKQRLGKAIETQAKKLARK
jgi:HK97 gp10 family phage protein